MRVSQCGLTQENSALGYLNPKDVRVLQCGHRLAQKDPVLGCLKDVRVSRESTEGGRKPDWGLAQWQSLGVAHLW